MPVGPPTAPLSVVLPPAQMVTSGPAFATSASTVTVTASVPEHPPLEAVTVYVVVAVGVATGLAMLALLNPVVGNHVYVVPPEAPSVAVPPQASVMSAPALTEGNELM